MCRSPSSHGSLSADLPTTDTYGLPKGGSLRIPGKCLIIVAYLLLQAAWSSDHRAASTGQMMWADTWCDREVKFVGNQGTVSLSKPLITQTSLLYWSPTLRLPGRRYNSQLAEEKTDSGKKNDLPHIKQLVSRRNTTQSQACLTLSSALFCYDTSKLY